MNIVPIRRGRRGNAPVPMFSTEALWFAAQVNYVRALAGDGERQARYLRGIELVHGPDMAERVRIEAQRT